MAPTPARAHTDLERSTPADGATVSSLPALVHLRFTQDVIPGTAVVALTGPRGEVGLGAPSVRGRDVRMTLPAVPSPGRHRLVWRVVAGDGHPVRGVLTLDITSAVATPTVPAPATPAVPATSAPLDTPAELAARAGVGGLDTSQSGEPDPGEFGPGPQVRWAGFAGLLLLVATAPRALARRRTNPTTELD
ncbi:MAG: copper resistance CopC family protein [Dermatophilaceae bacterium]